MPAAALVLPYAEAAISPQARSRSMYRVLGAASIADPGHRSDSGIAFLASCSRHGQRSRGYLAGSR
jgi:hypothetical protein